MYSSVIRDAEYIAGLGEFIHTEYGIVSDRLTTTKRGFYGETWCLECGRKRYFIKIVYAPEHLEIYKRSFSVVRHLCDHGIDFISKIIETKTGKLFSYYDNAIVGVFDWIDGELTENDETKIPEYKMLAKVYTVPSTGLTIPRENFSGVTSDLFYDKLKSLKDKQLSLLLEKYCNKIEHRAKRLKHFTSLCRSDKTGFVITHGDAGGNLIVCDNESKYFIVDWDTAILAPPERDAWVMCSKEWARNAFQSALHDNRIFHTLKHERLAFYCYDFFFYYLNAFLDASTNAAATSTIETTATIYTSTTSSSAELVEDYITGWIEDSFNYFENY